MFACPSRYLPKSSSSSSGGGDGALSAPSDDDEDEVHHAAATAARRRLERGQEGHVYAIVKTAPGMPLANASKELKMWSITHNDSENNNNNSSSQDDMAVDQDENMVANQSSCSKMVRRSCSHSQISHKVVVFTLLSLS